MTGAERGTIIHRILSLIQLDGLKSHTEEGLWQELRRLEESNCITTEENNVVNHHDLLHYFQSDLGQRMMNSPLVRREWSFNLRLKENTLLQGVIDCAFEENDGWILVDYKTDHITDEQAFIQRYAMQLNWYARALETITKKPVHEMWLYALRKATAYPVKRE